MERFLLGLLLGLVSVGSGTPAWSPIPVSAAAEAEAPPLDADELEGLATAATHRVFAFGCATASNTGTAVAIADDELLTSLHVVAGALLINVAGDTGPTAIAHARVHPTHDLALLRVPPAGGTVLELAPADPEPGDSMLVSGFVHDELSLTIETATVLDYADGATRGHDGPVMQLDLVVPEGMSGAPVIDDRGRLAGLVYAVEDPPGMTLAIPVSALARAVSRQAQAFLPDTRCG